MKLEITTKKTTEIEIEFPYYTKIEGIYMFKFLSENDCIEIDYGVSEISISIKNYYHIDFLLEEKITAKEFNSKFTEVLKTINDIQLEG